MVPMIASDMLSLGQAPFAYAHALATPPRAAPVVGASLATLWLAARVREAVAVSQVAPG